MEHVGWICRLWTETTNGWISTFATFASEEEAIEHGQWHNQHITDDELAREYEVYKDFA